MYRMLPLEQVVPDPRSPNRLSRMFAKKLRHNIGQLGKYETLTVRPSPDGRRKYQVLNGHARLEALRELGVSEVKCDVWEVSETQARLFLAVVNRLRGSDVPELRMNLLFQLLRKHSKEELAARLPETIAYLDKVERIPEEAERLRKEALPEKTEVVIVDFYLTAEQHRVIDKALGSIKKEFGLRDPSEALARMAVLYLDQFAKTTALRQEV